MRSPELPGPRGLRTGDEGQRPWRHHPLSEGGAEWSGPGQTEGRSRWVEGGEETRGPSGEGLGAGSCPERGPGLPTPWGGGGLSPRSECAAPGHLPVPRGAPARRPRSTHPSPIEHLPGVRGAPTRPPRGTCAASEEHPPVPRGAPARRPRSTHPSPAGHLRGVRGAPTRPPRGTCAASEEHPPVPRGAPARRPRSTHPSPAGHLRGVQGAAGREATCHTIFTDSIRPPHHGPGTCTYSDKHNLAKTNLFTAARCKYESTVGSSLTSWQQGYCAQLQNGADTGSPSLRARGCGSASRSPEPVHLEVSPGTALRVSGAEVNTLPEGSASFSALGEAEPGPWAAPHFLRETWGARPWRLPSAAPGAPAARTCAAGDRPARRGGGAGRAQASERPSGPVLGRPSGAREQPGQKPSGLLRDPAPRAAAQVDGADAKAAEGPSQILSLGKSLTRSDGPHRAWRPAGAKGRAARTSSRDRRPVGAAGPADCAPPPPAPGRPAARRQVPRAAASRSTGTLHPRASGPSGRTRVGGGGAPPGPRTPGPARPAHARATRVPSSLAALGVPRAAHLARVCPRPCPAPSRRRRAHLRVEGGARAPGPAPGSAPPPPAPGSRRSAGAPRTGSRERCAAPCSRPCRRDGAAGGPWPTGKWPNFTVSSATD
ncbi:collagen alpha-1(I) chain-like [Vulpes lagopus]|uniref:collagen alpha-1(I) chain-like n=1 Tax=Vulpes lagopus TaxID=494514 RepID=UPI001BC9B12F|nr:collagen alpha-1(I) chain-like [Vulpes lagopus]